MNPLNLFALLRALFNKQAREAAKKVVTQAGKKTSKKASKKKKKVETPTGGAAPKDPKARQQLLDDIYQEEFARTMQGQGIRPKRGKFAKVARGLGMGIGAGFGIDYLLDEVIDVGGAEQQQYQARTVSDLLSELAQGDPTVSQFRTLQDTADAVTAEAAATTMVSPFGNLSDQVMAKQAADAEELIMLNDLIGRNIGK